MRRKNLTFVWAESGSRWDVLSSPHSTAGVGNLGISQSKEERQRPFCAGEVLHILRDLKSWTGKRLSILQLCRTLEDNNLH